MDEEAGCFSAVPPRPCGAARQNDDLDRDVKTICQEVHGRAAKAAPRLLLVDRSMKGSSRVSQLCKKSFD